MLFLIQLFVQVKSTCADKSSKTSRTFKFTNVNIPVSVHSSASFAIRLSHRVEIGVSTIVAILRLSCINASNQIVVKASTAMYSYWFTAKKHMALSFNLKLAAVEGAKSILM